MEDLMRMALANALAAVAMGAVVATLGLALARRPAVVHALWVLVLLKLLTPPLFDVPVGAPGAVEETAAAISFVASDDVDLETLDWTPVDPLEVATLAPPVDPPRPIGAATAWRFLAVAWLAGSLATAALAGSRIFRFQRRLRDLSPAGPAVEEEVAALSAAMGLRRPPEADFIDARVAPMLWGLAGRPRLVLPRKLWSELDDRRRSLLLAHELAHLKRGDHWTRLLELAATVLYWWLPLVWWVRRSLRDAEEQCCDAWVVWMFPDDARVYAETLLDAVDFLNPGAEPTPLLASGFGKARHLRRRLTMVMRGATPRTLGWKGSLGALALAGVLLPIAPTWAQKAPGTETVVTSETRTDQGGEKGKDKADKTRDGGISTITEIQVIHSEPKEKMTKAIEGLKARIGEIESKEGRGEGDAVQLEALKSALRTLESLAAKGIADIEVISPRSLVESLQVQPDRAVIGRPNPNDPKYVEAKKRVEELQKDLAEKQKAFAEAAGKLGEAQRDLARLQLQLTADWTEGLRVKGVQPLAPRIAEGRAIIRNPNDAGEKARIDALERKLDQVLKRLEGLKNNEPEDPK